jgi:DNA-binding NarL/FixJ family response regulator
MSDRILVLDNDRALREDICTTLRREGYVCDPASGAQGLATLQSGQYGVVLTDFESAAATRFELIDAAERLRPAVAIIVIASHPSMLDAIGSLRHGVCDYVIQPIDTAELLSAVARALKFSQRRRRLEEIGGQLGVLAREMRVPPTAHNGASAALVSGTEELELSPRERTVAEAIADGTRVEKLAAALNISERTVRNHLQACFRKLGVHSQIELAARLRRRTD